MSALAEVQFRPREYRLEDALPEYAAAVERLEELRQRRERLLAEAQAEARAAAAEAERVEEEVIAAEADALQRGEELDPARWREVERAKEKARRAEEALRRAERQAEALRIAIERQQAEVERLADEAKVLIAERARQEHEAAMRRLVRAVRELAAAFREEQEIFAGAERVLGNSGLYRWWPPTAPERLLDARVLAAWEEDLRRHGYDIDGDEEGDDAAEAAAS